jgi:uncharacterized glyoxalase superfamily protein PhnB
MTRMNRLMVFLKYPKKKNIFKMGYEVLTILVKKKEIPYYYFKYLYRKSVPNYLDYISFKEQKIIVSHPYLHNPEYYSLINNKLYFGIFSELTSIKTPKLISYNLGNSFFFKNEFIQIFNIDELIAFYQKVFETSNLDELFFRPHSKYGGEGCFKLNKLNIKNELEARGSTILQGDFVQTEVILQHEKINQIHRKCLNTLRVITLITSEGITEIVSAYMRFGVGDSVVDNASSGGFFVGINLEDGTLKSNGNYLPEFGGEVVKKHPDSGFKFKGFEIPYYREAINSVISGVKIIPNRWIGWDIAITQTGPLIIETNSETHIPVSDIAYGGLLKNKYIKELMGELKAMN